MLMAAAVTVVVAGTATVTAAGEAVMVVVVVVVGGGCGCGCGGGGGGGGDGDGSDCVGRHPTWMTSYIDAISLSTSMPSFIQGVRISLTHERAHIVPRLQ